jgi:ABC-type phosphate transport system permease subunit
MGVTALLQPPVTVRIIAPPEDPTGGLGDVLLGSLGLTGVMVLIAVAAGALFAGILFYIRSRSS